MLKQAAERVYGTACLQGTWNDVSFGAVAVLSNSVSERCSKAVGVWNLNPNLNPYCVCLVAEDRLPLPKGEATMKGKGLAEHGPADVFVAMAAEQDRYW